MLTSFIVERITLILADDLRTGPTQHRLNLTDLVLLGSLLLRTMRDDVHLHLPSTVVAVFAAGRPAAFGLTDNPVLWWTRLVTAASAGSTVCS